MLIIVLEKMIAILLEEVIFSSLKLDFITTLLSPFSAIQVLCMAVLFCPNFIGSEAKN